MRHKILFYQRNLTTEHEQRSVSTTKLIDFLLKIRIYNNLANVDCRLPTVRTVERQFMVLTVLRV